MMERTVARMGLVLVTSMLLSWEAQAATLTWNVTGYTGTWDTASTNWLDGVTPAVFSNGDDVIFPTFADLGGGSHSTHNTVTIADGGVSPGSITFNPAEINFLHFAGADIGGAAGGIVVDSTWAANQAQLRFDASASYSFTGDVTVTDGNRLYYTPTAAGTYSLGTGELKFQRTGTSSTDFNYEPTVTGTTLTNDIRVESGTLTFNWGNAPTFSGDLYLDSNIFFNSAGGGQEFFDWTGDVILSGNRTIVGGVRDISRPGGLHFAGQFQGAAHTLTLDFNPSNPNHGLSIQAMQDSTAWDVGDLVLTNGSGPASIGGNNTPNLLVHTTNATDDHFALLRGNGGKVSIENGAQLFLRKGTLNFADLQSDATGQVIVDISTVAYDARLSGNGMELGSAAGYVQTATIGQTTGAKGFFGGDVTVRDGGTLILRGQYNEMVKHSANPLIANSGNLTLLDGSVIESHWGIGISNLQLSSCYEMQSAAQLLNLGDGNAGTQETITIRGVEDQNTGAATGSFYFGTNNGSIVDDGNVVLRYESIAATGGVGDFNVAWSDLTSIQAVGYNSGNVAYQFRGGSAGTEFAPLSSDNSIGAIGPSIGTVFTATSATSLVTTGTVGFYNSTTSSPTGHRGALGNVIVTGNAASFDLTANGRAEAATITAQNGATLSGIGTFGADVVVLDATVSPGNSIGTLTIDGNLNLSSSSVLLIEADSTDSDEIIVWGDLILDGTVQLIGSPVLSQTYTLFTFSGSLTDNGLEFLPGGGFARLRVDIVGNEVQITPVPEPSVLACLLAGGVALWRRPRRR